MGNQKQSETKDSRQRNVVGCRQDRLYLALKFEAVLFGYSYFKRHLLTSSIQISSIELSCLIILWGRMKNVCYSFASFIPLPRFWVLGISFWCHKHIVLSLSPSSFHTSRSSCSRFLLMQFDCRSTWAFLVLQQPPFGILHLLHKFPVACYDVTFCLYRSACLHMQRKSFKNNRCLPL